MQQSFDLTEHDIRRVTLLEQTLADIGDILVTAKAVVSHLHICSHAFQKVY